MPMVQTPLRMPQDMLDMIDRMAEAEQRSRSNMLLILVHEAVNARIDAAQPPKRKSKR